MHAAADPSNAGPVLGSTAREKEGKACGNRPFLFASSWMGEVATRIEWKHRRSDRLAEHVSDCRRRPARSTSDSNIGCSSSERRSNEAEAARAQPTGCTPCVRPADWLDRSPEPCEALAGVIPVRATFDWLGCSSSSTPSNSETRLATGLEAGPAASWARAWLPSITPPETVVMQSEREEKSAEIHGNSHKSQGFGSSNTRNRRACSHWPARAIWPSRRVDRVGPIDLLAVLLIEIGRLLQATPR